ncbi:NAD-dependent epimerase/dehydratase family protein [Kribbella sp. NBC_01505]|uniref:NAD-dependent epimerase/dehydratase family protein n=1 Tax=Kribbella sp. NBC_01505 TaxID=2903580 RepID=UPI00386C65FC
MRVLLTGGAGFIGRHVHTQLTGEGHDVLVLDSLRPDVHRTRPEPSDDLVVGDIRNAEDLRRALSGVDTVIHLAAKVGLGVDLDDIDDYVSTNSLGTAVLLREMAHANLRHLVYASSMVVYGEGRYDCDRHGQVAPGPRRPEDLDAGQFDPPCPLCDEPLRPGLIAESAPVDPRNAYAASKLNGEHLAASWSRETGSRVTALRFHNVYGPGMPRNTPYAGVAAIFRSALERGEAPKVYEDGRQRRDFIHVHDIASAVTTAAGALPHQPPFTAYNVGTDTVNSIGDLATELAHAYQGPPPVVTGQYRLGDVRHITASSTKLRNDLGWKPTLDLRTGLADLLASGN